MNMAADPNMNFHYGVFPSSICNQYEVSFQSGAANSSALVGGGINTPGGTSRTSGMMLAGNPGILGSSSSMMLQGNSQGNLLIEPIAGLKHDTGLAVDWSYKEQAILSHGLIKFADQPHIMKYIKIAALLPEKTVRDVALRCQWMNRSDNCKRRKLEEYIAGKKFKDSKEKMLDSSTKVNIHPLGYMAGYPFEMHHMNKNNRFFAESSIVDVATRRLLEENAQIFIQIASNLESFKTTGNIDLFLRSRDNIVAILNSMSGTPGIMSQMPPLPVTIHEELVTSIMPSSSQAFIFSSEAGTTVKQEPSS